jgi:hypothetical protein
MKSEVMVMPSRIHFVCRSDTRRGYTTTHPGTFTTAAWRVSDRAAAEVEVVALHHSKKDQSWAQGRVVAKSKKDNRWIFTVALSDDPYVWPTDPKRGPEKAYVSL